MQRFVTLLSRAEAPVEGVLRGYAAVYDQPMSRPGGGWNPPGGGESIARGAFDGALGGDVIACVDHDRSKLLARTSSGTLSLFSDATGLGFEFQVPDTQLGRDTYEMVRRGDYLGASFTATLGEYDQTDGGVVHRSFGALYDVAIVGTPAYDGAKVVARNAVQRSLAAQMAAIRARLFMERYGR